MIGIYKITSPSDKIYIGQSTDIENRWLDYKRYKCKEQKYLYNSLKKYLYENHIFEILEECNIENLNIQERFWQDYYDVLNREKGLNLVLINTNEKRRVFSIEVIERTRAANRGQKRSLETRKKISISKLGMKHTEETKKYIGDCQRGELHWTTYKKYSEESKKKMSEAQKQLYLSGYIHPNKRSIIQYNLENEFIKEWESITEAQIIYGKGIANCVQNKNKTAYGYKWKYKE